MDAILKYSALNPLAACFVPSTLKQPKVNNCQSELLEAPPKDTADSIPILKARTITEVNEFKKDFSPVSNAKSSEPPHLEAQFIKEDFIQCDDLEHSKKPSDAYVVFLAANYIKIIFVTMFGFYCTNRGIPNQTPSISKTEANSEKRYRIEKCTCPPMFGYALPPDFFGNPFKIRPCCNKKDVHACHLGINADMVPERQQFSKDITKDETLENVVKEFKEIIADICNMVRSQATESIEEVSNMDAVTFTSETNTEEDFYSQTQFFESMKSCQKLHEDVTSNRSMFVGHDAVAAEVKISDDPPVLIDDDFHPLLEIAPGGRKGSSLNVLSARIPESGLKRASNNQQFSAKISNSPCSVWCDSQHNPCNDTYRKFIESFAQLENNLCDSPILKKNKHIVSFPKKQIGRKFTETYVKYKNSFSNETQRFTNSYFKSNCNRPTTKFNNYVPVDISRKQTRTIGDGRHDIWQSVDGKDSLWSPLPDCVQTLTYK